MPRKKKAPPHGWIDPKTGQLYAVLNYTDRQGKRRQKYRKAADVDHVRELYGDMVKTLQTKGEDALDTHKKTFADLARFYKKHHVKEAVYVDGRKISGFRRKIKDVEHEVDVLDEHFGKMTLSSIHFEDIRDFRDGLYKKDTVRKKPPAVSTVNHYMKRMRRMLNIAERKGWIARSPFVGEETLVTSTHETERTRRLLPGEEDRLLAQCVDVKRKGWTGPYQYLAHMRPIIIAAIDTAMRQGELLYKLKKPQVDLEKGIITVMGQWGGTKTMRSRHVPITPRLKAELEKLFEETKDDPEGPVFDQKSCKSGFARVCRQAKVKGLNFHDLRHEGTFRILAACGGNYVLAMKITGHTQMKTFMRYINVDVQSVQQVAENLANLAFQAPEVEPEGEHVN